MKKIHSLVASFLFGSVLFVGTAFADFTHYQTQEQLASHWPSLKAAERSLAWKNPKKALIAIVLGYAILNTDKSSSSDKGMVDALRHVSWTALMTKYIDADFALLWSSAHETESDNTAAMREMDLYNNRVGIQLAKSLITQKTNPTSKDFESAILSAAALGKFKIITNDSDDESDREDKNDSGDSSNPRSIKLSSQALLNGFVTGILSDLLKSAENVIERLNFTL